MNTREIRKKYNLTQKEFARQIGVSTATVGFWEIGERKPSEESMQKIKNTRLVAVYDIDRGFAYIDDKRSIVESLGWTGSITSFIFNQYYIWKKDCPEVGRILNHSGPFVRDCIKKHGGILRPKGGYRG